MNGVRADEIRALVRERDHGGPYDSIGALAGRSGASAGTLGKLAWAGACDVLVIEEAPAGEARDEPSARHLTVVPEPPPDATLTARRRALRRLGVAVPGTKVEGGTQLSLPLEPHDGPELRALTAWERMLADYGSTGVTLKEHPLELMRPALSPNLRTSKQLEQAGHGTRVEVAGLVVARQRPATANGITFMLLEDELGTINLIVPPPVHERCRLAIRSEPLIWARGRVEHSEGTTNVLVDHVGRLERPDLPHAEVRHIEPRRTWSTDDEGRFPAEVEEADLRAVVPAGHSFGRRGR